MAAEPATRERGLSRPTMLGSPGARERLLFATATGVIVLHILVASFLAIEPGAARTDHILAAVLPAALVVLAVVFYTRLRAGVSRGSGVAVRSARDRCCQCRSRRDGRRRGTG